MDGPGTWPGSTAYIATLSVLALLASLSVCLRFWCTRLTGVGLHLDDWLSLVTLFLNHAVTASVFLAFISYGFGLNAALVYVTYPDVFIKEGIVSFASAILYAASAFAVRLTAILFYFRIFPTSATRRNCFILGGLCVACLLIVIIVSFTGCFPIEANWDPAVLDARCVNNPVFAVIFSAINVVVDAWTVGLPVYEVLKLQMTRRRKYTVLGIFVIGGIATAASLARIIAVVILIVTAPTNAGPTTALLSALAIIEVYVGLIGANAPTLGPIYDRAWRRFGGSLSSTSQRQSQARSEGQPRSRPGLLNHPSSTSHLRQGDGVGGPFELLEEEPTLIIPTPTNRSGTSLSLKSTEEIPMHFIKIDRDQHRL